MYGDLHFGHLSSNGSSLKPHSPHIAIFLASLKEDVSVDVASIDFLISSIFAFLSISNVTSNPPLSNFENLLHSVIISLLLV